MSTQARDTRVASSSLRNGADAAFGVLAVITVVLAAVQIGLAGLGAFGGGFRPHMTHGYVVALFTVLMLVAALIARPSRSVVTRAVVLFVLAVPVQPVLATVGAGDSSWVGALHAISGVAITGLAGALAGETRLRRSRSGTPA